MQTALAVPIADAEVAVYDSTQTALYCRGTTNASGQFTASLEDGTYKLRLRLMGYTFTVPETLTVSGDTAKTCVGTVLVPAAPSAGLQTVYGYVYELDGSLAVGATVSAQVSSASQVVATALD